MSRTQIESVEKQVNDYNIGIKCYSYQLALNAIAKIVYKKQAEKWEVDYKTQVDNWLKHIKSEYDWHNQSLSSYEGSKYVGLNRIARLETYKIKEGDVIMDIGCGPMLKYQNSVNGVNVKMIPVDPLAHLYNHILSKYEIAITNSINFALGEHLSMFFDKESANYILFDNSLDHTINPVRCLFESYELLKKVEFYLYTIVRLKAALIGVMICTNGFFMKTKEIFILQMLMRKSKLIVYSVNMQK